MLWRADNVRCLPVVLFGNFPAFNLRQSEIGDGDLEWKFRHPNGEAREALIGAVLDEDTRIGWAAQFRSINVNRAARWWNLLIDKGKRWLLLWSLAWSTIWDGKVSHSFTQHTMLFVSGKLKSRIDLTSSRFRFVEVKWKAIHVHAHEERKPNGNRLELRSNGAAEEDEAGKKKKASKRKTLLILGNVCASFSRKRAAQAEKLWRGGKCVSSRRRKSFDVWAETTSWWGLNPMTFGA